MTQLIGENIKLAPSTENDLEDFVRWINDPEVTRYLVAGSDGEMTLEKEKEWFEGIQSDPNEILLSIFTLKDQKLIGNCGIHFNEEREDEYSGETFLGLVIGEKDEWGKGYGTETVSLLLDYLKEQGTETVCLLVYCENFVAQAVYKKCGFEIAKKGIGENGRDEYLMVCSF